MPSTSATPEEAADSAFTTGANQLESAGSLRAGSRVTVRYWAGARAAAGLDAEVVELAPQSPNPGQVSVGAVLAEVAARHTSLVAVLAVASILVDGSAVGADELLEDGATLEVLPPFAGG